MALIGIDCRFAGTKSGLGRYTTELVCALLAREDPVEYVLFTRGDHSWLPKDAKVPFTRKTTDIPHYSLREQLLLPRLLRRSGVDLFFSPHFNVPRFCPVPFVATVHDLILHRFPNDTPLLRRMAYRFLMRSTIDHAQAIIAVSRFTASELVATYGSDRAHAIHVVAEAPSARFRHVPEHEAERVLTAHGITRPYLLYVGNAKQHKNVQMLIDAYAALPGDKPMLALVIAGRESSRLRLVPGVRIIHAVQDDDLPALYSTARCFVTATLYEGYGLPLLEAASCGCPVIATNVAALPETAPEGAVLVPPTREAFTEALSDPPRDPPIAPARTWHQVAEETAQILLGAVTGGV